MKKGALAPVSRERGSFGPASPKGHPIWWGQRDKKYDRERRRAGGLGKRNAKWMGGKSAAVGRVGTRSLGVQASCKTANRPEVGEIFAGARVP